jgi:hypothetical protein
MDVKEAEKIPHDAAGLAKFRLHRHNIQQNIRRISQRNEKRTIMTRKDDAQIKEKFRQRRSSQLLAMAVALMLIVLLAIIQKSPAFFGETDKNTIAGLQVIVIAAFIGFTAVNWRCPACRKYLAGGINSPACGKCGARLR